MCASGFRTGVPLNVDRENTSIWNLSRFCWVFVPLPPHIFGICHIISHLSLLFVSLSMGICHCLVCLLSRFHYSFICFSISCDTLYIIYCFIYFKKERSFFLIFKKWVLSSYTYLYIELGICHTTLKHSFSTLLWYLSRFLQPFFPSFVRQIVLGICHTFSLDDDANNPSNQLCFIHLMQVL